mmetsp:Transcript_3243/g.8271  ORF Transcript_3243/g.8271 Transcript_3243/m.8271 type:complete len:208 (+) Transcript_3243:850-1473(+)
MHAEFINTRRAEFLKAGPPLPPSFPECSSTKARTLSAHALVVMFPSAAPSMSKARKKSTSFDDALKAPAERERRNIDLFTFLPRAKVFNNLSLSELRFKIPFHSCLIANDVSLSTLEFVNIDDFARASKTQQMVSTSSGSRVADLAALAPLLLFLLHEVESIRLAVFILLHNNSIVRVLAALSCMAFLAPEDGVDNSRTSSLAIFPR